MKGNGGVEYMCPPPPSLPPSLHEVPDRHCIITLQACSLLFLVHALCQLLHAVQRLLHLPVKERGVGGGRWEWGRSKELDLRVEVVLQATAKPTDEIHGMSRRRQGVEVDESSTAASPSHEQAIPAICRCDSANYKLLRDSALALLGGSRIHGSVTRPLERCLYLLLMSLHEIKLLLDKLLCLCHSCHVSLFNGGVKEEDRGQWPGQAKGDAHSTFMMH